MSWLGGKKRTFDGINQHASSSLSQRPQKLLHTELLLSKKTRSGSDPKEENHISLKLTLISSRSPPTTSWTRETIDVFIPAPYAFWWLPISSIFSCPFPFFDVRLWMVPWLSSPFFLLRRTFHCARQLNLTKQNFVQSSEWTWESFQSVSEWFARSVDLLNASAIPRSCAKISNFCFPCNKMPLVNPWPRIHHRKP